MASQEGNESGNESNSDGQNNPFRFALRQQLNKRREADKPIEIAKTVEAAVVTEIPQSPISKQKIKPDKEVICNNILKKSNLISE